MDSDFVALYLDKGEWHQMICYNFFFVKFMWRLSIINAEKMKKTAKEYGWDRQFIFFFNWETLH